MILTDKQIQSFWKKVDKSGDCWEWIKTTDRKGYGLISLNGKNYRATRISWMIANGRMPYPDMDICHTCDNPRCVNPAHLWEGTRKQNLQDASRKGRTRSGTQKLSVRQVLEIRRATGKQTEIAQRYRIHPSTVGKIQNHVLWRTLA